MQYELNESVVAELGIKLTKKVVLDLHDYYKTSLGDSKIKIIKSKEQLKKVITSIDDINKLNEEKNNLHNLCKSGLKWCLKGFPKDMLKSVNMLENGDIISDDLVESILFEAKFSIPDLFNKIIEKIQNTFPFNILEHFSNKAEFFSKKVLNNISLFLVKINAIDEPYYFTIIPAIIGSLAEVAIKDIGKESLLHFIPGISFILRIISILSYSITLVSLIHILMKDFTASKSMPPTTIPPPLPPQDSNGGQSVSAV